MVYNSLNHYLTEMVNKTFDSKISWFILVPLIAVFGSIILLDILNGISWAGLAVSVVTIAFITHLYRNTKYIINGDELTIKSGFLYKTNIDIKSVNKLVETNSLLSSPALSIDRISIQYNKYDEVMVSPKDKAGFISALTSINPKIEVKGK